MNEAMGNNPAQTCPQCDNHCPVDALQCGRGRKYFGVADDGHEHSHGRSHPKSGLTGLLHRCGRYACHADMGEDELFQALSDEEKATLQTLLEKLAANWQERCGEEGFDRGCHGHHHGHKDGKHHKHEGHKE